MLQTFSILFSVKRNKTKSGKAPICARVTVDGKRAEISTHRFASIQDWNPEAQMVVSKSQESKAFNNDLAVIKGKILSCQSKLESRGETITAEKIKNEYIDKRPQQKTILQAFDFKLKQLKEEVQSQKKAPATFDKYQYTKDKVESFIKQQYKTNDRLLNDINYSFATDFEHYLSVTLGLDNNTSMKYLSRTKSVIKMAVEREWV